MPAAATLGKLYDVEFAVVKAKTGNFEGKKDTYRRDVRKATVFVAAGGADAKTILTNNLTLASGEAVEIIHLSNHDIGGEGTAYSYQ